jgi:elongation factor P
MLGLSDCKTGAKLVLDGEPYIVVWNQFSKTARQGGVMKTKLKNLLTGKVMEKTFQGSDRVEEADVVFRKAQFLYKNENEYEFMDNETYETVTLSEDVIGDMSGFLVDGMNCDLQLFNGEPINVQLQPKMTFEIVYTEPGVQGDRANGGTKPATISTGKVIRVPLFVSQGDKVVVNTESGEYVERAK